MKLSLLSTKFHVPRVRATAVSRIDLITRLENAFDRKLILLSAPAGFGKSTLAAQWTERLLSVPPPDVASTHVAWLTLEEEDNDYLRFLAYLAGALRSMRPPVEGSRGLGVKTAEPVRLPHPMPEQVLVPLINRLAEIDGNIVLVLDDYHHIDGDAAHATLAFLIENMPRNLHLVIATRHDPPLPLARLRAEDEMVELRARDLRFTVEETAEFMRRAMDLELSMDEVTALERRTEGWPAGLQLVGMSLQGSPDAGKTIGGFTGSHRHVADYLVEEVLRRQPEPVQRFLLQTSILDRLCGPLCDAVTGRSDGTETLRLLERTNAFILPLDGDRRWYRYHELFADLLRQQLRAAAPADELEIAALHDRAGRWHEERGMEVEAFRHATAAQDLDRAERLLRGRGMPLHFRGAAPAVFEWLRSLPHTILDARPALWVTYAAASVFVGQSAGVGEMLGAAERALQAQPAVDDDTIGRIAAIRAMLAVSRNEVETIVAESRRALSHLSPENRPVRTASSWALGVALQARGDRAAATEIFCRIIEDTRSSGNTYFSVGSLVRRAGLLELDNHLHRARASYRRVLERVGDAILPFACEAHLGLARIAYEWNELEEARRHERAMLRIARWMRGSDLPAACWAVAARLRLIDGDADGAAALLEEAEDFARRHDYAHRLIEVIGEQVKLLVSVGRLEAAACRSMEYDIPLARVRVQLARGDARAALTVLEPLETGALARNWVDLQLKVMILKALALERSQRRPESLACLEQALLIAEPEGFIRVFVDEGAPMARLLCEASTAGIAPEYTSLLLSHCTGADGARGNWTDRATGERLIEPLSLREIEILRQIAQGLSNEEVGTRLFISPHTVKAHTRNIYAKLDAHNRTEAVARARSFGLLDDRRV